MPKGDLIDKTSQLQIKAIYSMNLELCAKTWNCPGKESYSNNSNCLLSFDSVNYQNPFCQSSDKQLRAIHRAVVKGSKESKLPTLAMYIVRWPSPVQNSACMQVISFLGPSIWE